MRRFLYGGRNTVQILRSVFETAEGREITFHSQSTAKRYLSNYLGNYTAMQTLRSCVSEKQAYGVHNLDDHEIIERMAFTLVDGSYRFVELSSPDYETFLLPERKPDAEEEQEEEQEQWTWVGLQFVGEDDQPVAHESFELKLPDGSVKRGRTDSYGYADTQNIYGEGDCELTFVDLDQDAWKEA